MTAPNPYDMLLRNRPPAIETEPVPSAKTFEQIDDSAVAVLRWLNANRVDYIVVGAVARIVRGDSSSRGPVSIVPAPYGRNLDRLARALTSARARVRLHVELGPGFDSATGHSASIRVTAERLVNSERLTLRCGTHDIDVEGRPAGVPRYQELLYEAAKYDLAEGVSAEIAAPEDIEHYDHMRRTGLPPEIRVTRAVRTDA
jgi:hypothetical protein